MNHHVIIDVTNHRGERAERIVIPHPDDALRWGSTEYHKEPQWLLEAYDVTKEAPRTFAMKNVHGWRPNQMTEDNTPVLAAAAKLQDKLKDCYWPDGGFLQSVGVGLVEDKEVIYCYLARKLARHEKFMIPAEVDGFPVVTKVIGKLGIKMP